MREAVRSGRRTNFFITENRFIDHYAARVGGSGVAVYSILQRCANSETRETWISAQKMADILAMDKSTVYRHLKQLEDLRLIRTLRTREKTIYVVLPVPPPRPEAGTAPLFEVIDRETSAQDSKWPPVASVRMDRSNESDSCQNNWSVASERHQFAAVQPVSCKNENRNKEEQDTLNKTQEQELSNKTGNLDNREIAESAYRIMRGLGLPDNLLNGVTSAVESKAEQTNLSADGIVNSIATDARNAERVGITNEKFFDDFIARSSAQKIVDDINLPATNNLIKTVTAAVKAEAKDRGLSVQEAAALITAAAVEDRKKGLAIDRFYFENAKWRSHARTGKGQQQFERIKRARDEAHAIIDAEMDH